MKISIITICFNSVDTIEDTIKSVISQTYNNIEYILIDGGSTDGTHEIITKYDHAISSLISEPDKGIYDAMNKGIQAATGDIIGILNSDDLYADDNVLSDVVEKFRASNADALYADLVYVNRINSNSISRYWKAGNFDSGKFKYGWMPPHPTFFLKKSCYEKWGDYNLLLKSSADYELMLRMLYKHKIPVVYLPRVTVKMRIGGQSNITIKNRILANREDKLAWKINGLKTNAFTFIFKPLLKIHQFFRRENSK